MKGQLIITDYRERQFAFLIRENRLIAAQLMPKENNAIGAIFIAKVKKAVPSIDAYFVEIADKEICFLPQKEVFPARKLKEGEEIAVQVIREAQKTKQATVSTRLSLSNDVLAISIGREQTGFSNKLAPEERDRLKNWVGELPVFRQEMPEEMPSFGLVVRTNAANCDKETFLQKGTELIEEFFSLLSQIPYRTCHSQVQEAPDGYESVFDRMIYVNEIQEVITDDKQLFNKLQLLFREKKWDLDLRFYEDQDFTLTKLYGLQSKMDMALEKRVWLKSGGYLVIEHTEAMTVIDVNSGKYSAGKGSFEMVRRINMEAAEEIALQLRLRNLSGMILVDFINLKEDQDPEELLNYLRDLVRRDHLKTHVVDMTPLGLVEITRKKLYKTLREQIAEI